MIEDPLLGINVMSNDLENLYALTYADAFPSFLNKVILKKEMEQIVKCVALLEKFKISELIEIYKKEVYSLIAKDFQGVSLKIKNIFRNIEIINKQFNLDKSVITKLFIIEFYEKFCLKCGEYTLPESELIPFTSLLSRTVDYSLLNAHNIPSINSNTHFTFLLLLRSENFNPSDNNIIKKAFNAIMQYSLMINQVFILSSTLIDRYYLSKIEPSSFLDDFNTGYLDSHILRLKKMELVPRDSIDTFLENIIHETRNKPIVRRLTVTRMITALNVILDDVYE